MKKFIILLICITCTLMLNAQCGENGNYWNQSWVSCTTYANPNPQRGDTSHWILYEFQEPQYIDSTYVWNANRAGESGWGAKDVVIDYSPDGTSWVELGQFFFPQAPETSDYEGFLGPEFDGVLLEKILITILSTHDGGSCASLAELQFKIDPTACYGEVDACGICNGPGESIWYFDADLDGLGDPNNSIDACTQPPGYVDNMGDLCDDGSFGWADVAPLFTDNGCTGCHGAGASGGLDLLSYNGIAAGGNICGTNLLTGTNLVDIINIPGYDGCGTPIPLPSMNARVSNQFDTQELAALQAWVNGGAPELCTDYCIPSEEEEMIDICESENYTFPDGTTQNNIMADVTYISSLTSSGGCDSTITTNLIVQANYDTLIQVALCSGEDYTFPDGSTMTNITTNTSHTSNFQTSAGCDSIIQSDIEVLLTYNQSTNVSLCSGSSYTFADGTIQNNITADMTYTSALTSSAGCDSIIVTSISVVQDVITSESFDICEGSSYTFPDGSTQNDITNDIQQMSLLTSSEGCDSLVITNLYVYDIYAFNDSSQICEGGSYTFPDGSTENNITEDWVYISNLLSVHGCDSLITTELFVTSVDTSVEVQGATLTAVLSAESYQWLDCESNFEAIPGATDHIFNASQSGTYAVAITQDGCVDTSTCYTVSIVSTDQIEKLSYGLKPNPVRETLYLVGKFDQAPNIEIYNTLGQICFVPFNVTDFSLNVNHLAAGVYYLKLQIKEEVYLLEFVKQW